MFVFVCAASLYIPVRMFSNIFVQLSEAVIISVHFLNISFCMSSWLLAKFDPFSLQKLMSPLAIHPIPEYILYHIIIVEMMLSVWQRGSYEARMSG